MFLNPTKHPSRLDREFGRKRWDDEGYAAEEPVAELGAAFLSANLGITPEPREDHAVYIASWLEVLKNDKRAIFTATAHAERAAAWAALSFQLAQDFNNRRSGRDRPNVESQRGSSQPGLCRRPLRIGIS